MNRTGVAVAVVGAIQLALSSLLLFLFSQTSGADFSTYWAASGWTIWYPQYVAGFTLVVVGFVVTFVSPTTPGGSRTTR
tara:strand:+ start:1211 stop:1447 length:237 start_codon:yes stop_codon:yes gene_type:complete